MHWNSCFATVEFFFLQAAKSYTEVPWCSGLVAESCLTLGTPWTVACHAPPSLGFSWQGYWSGLPFPSPEALPYPGFKPWSPALQADSLPTELQRKLDVQ